MVWSGESVSSTADVPRFEVHGPSISLSTVKWVSVAKLKSSPKVQGCALVHLADINIIYYMVGYSME